MSTHPPASPQAPGPSVTLTPHYGVALGVVALGAGCLGFWPLWAGAPVLALVISGFGLFLVLQTALLRLEFSADALRVWREDTLLRRFPYDSWLSWRLFWPALPVLFFFREERSIHFLPVLFNPGTLHQQLELHLPQLSPSAETGPAADAR